MNNFERITQSPEALAEAAVFSYRDEICGQLWQSMAGEAYAGNDHYSGRDLAIQRSIIWLNQPVEGEEEG